MLDQIFQSLLKQEVADVSRLIKDSGHETLIEIFESISECEAIAKGQPGRLIGGYFDSIGTRATVIKEIGTGRVSRAGTSIWCLL